MLLELLPLIGGGIFGAVVKLISISMENKRNQNEMLINLHKVQQDAHNDANDHAANNQWFAWTRRALALAVTAMLASLIFLPFLDPTIPVNIMTEVTHGGSYLFGLIDTKVTEEVWLQLQGIVFHPVVGDAFLAIIGAYFGSSIASRS